MRFRIFLAAAAVLCAGVSAHADDFTFTLNGGAGGFSGTGTFTGSPLPGITGVYSISGVSGSNTNGIIGAGMYGNNDNLLTPNATYFVDSQGIAFYDQTTDGVYAVRLYQAMNGMCSGSSSQYCVDVQEVNTGAPTDPTTTLPVTFPGTTGDAAHFAVRFTLARAGAPSTTVAATPEPGSLMLLGSGALALAGFGRRRFLTS